MNKEPLTKIVIDGGSVWLVPRSLTTETFYEALHILNSTRTGVEVDWTKKQREEFQQVLGHPDVWRPL